MRNRHNAAVQSDNVQLNQNQKVNHKSAAILSNFNNREVSEEDSSVSKSLEKVYNVLIVLCVLLSLNLLVLGLYMKKINVMGYLKAKVFGRSATEYEELLK